MIVAVLTAAADGDAVDDVDSGVAVVATTSFLPML